MTVDEGLNWLLQLTVNTALSPFACGQGHMKTMPLAPNKVPCVKLIDRVGWAPYILFINKNGQPCILARAMDDDEPMKVISVEDLSATVRASDRWRQDYWLTDCPDWRVSNWYRENGWPINENHYGVGYDI